MKSDSRKRIETVADFVTAFGGTRALADWLDVGSSAVSNWKERNEIPAGWHLRLYLECQQRNLNVAPRLFGLAGRGNGKPSSRPSRRADARLVEAR